MSNRGKRYQGMAGKRERQTFYSLDDALQMVKDTASAKFDETVDVAINLGVWLNKYLMVVPVFSPDARPLDHLTDAGLSVALLVGFLGVVFLLTRWLPIYSFWEMKLTREPEV